MFPTLFREVAFQTDERCYLLADPCRNRSMRHCEGFLSARQRRIFVPWRNRPPDTWS